MLNKTFKFTFALLIGLSFFSPLSQAETPAESSEKPSLADKEYREERRKQEAEEHAKKFEWWPTDAKPGAVKDEERGGYWWYPTTPGKVMPWGNRGYIYVYKIIFDYKEDELPPAKENELRPSLLIRKVIKNVKVYFDYNKTELRDDAVQILDDGLYSLRKNPESSVLVTGNADVRGSEEYNFNLAKQRAEMVKKYFVDNGLDPERIRSVSQGKLQATAPVTDLVGMQKDRNVQFMVAEVDEVMLPYQGPPQNIPSQKVAESTYITQVSQNLESEVQVSEKEYVIKEGDSLYRIAQNELGNGNRWEFLYEYNKESIKNPNKLKAGQKIKIPVE